VPVRFAESGDRDDHALLLSPWPESLSGIERYALPDAVREDYLSSYEGDRFVESMRYVRTYPEQLPVLRDLLPPSPGRTARTTTPRWSWPGGAAATLLPGDGGEFTRLADSEGAAIMTAGAVTADGRARVLADGHQLPMLGLGVWQVPSGPECVNAVRWALESGYRHLDTAQAYGNEESVGTALRDSGVPREDVFITTKFYPGNDDPVAEAERSLRRLGVDQVDLYLVHWPQGGPTWAWPGMERACELGLARSVGVSNFSAAELDEVIAAGTIAPAVNQVQFSAPEYRRALLGACAQRGVALEAYSPLGTGRHLSSATVQRVAERAGRTPAQVLLRWCLQHDVPVIPKSTRRERISSNAQIFDFDLSAEDMAELDALDRTRGTDRALESNWW
jgi:diketogulonate reductase-like aldo/keto reductase